MEHHQLGHVKKLLQWEKTRSELNNHKIEEHELSTIDNHPADCATDLMMMTTARAALAGDIYGICKECGKKYRMNG